MRHQPTASSNWVAGMYGRSSAGRRGRMPASPHTRRVCNASVGRNAVPSSNPRDMCPVQVLPLHIPQQFHICQHFPFQHALVRFVRKEPARMPCYELLPPAQCHRHHAALSRHALHAVTAYPAPRQSYHRGQRQLQSLPVTVVVHVHTAHSILPRVCIA